MSAVDATHTLTRFYIPVGMMMGESNAEFKFVDAGATDHVGRSVQAFYKERSPAGYVRQWYGAPANGTSRSAADGMYIRSSWDVFCEAPQASGAQALLLSGYGRDNVDRQPVVNFAFRPRWNIRLPVAMCRANAHEWYDEMGGLRDIIQFGGAVIFDDVITLSNGAEPLNAYVDLLKIVAPQVTAPANDEVKAPEASGPAGA
jgi:hypothetical protein